MNIIEKIGKFGRFSGGVFSYADLFNMLGGASDLKNKRSIRRLVKEGVLFKIRRGFYTTSNPDLFVLACRIKPKAYISMDSALAKNGLIGAVPSISVSAVFPGARKKILRTPFGIIRYFSIQKKQIFGLTALPGGVRMADNEKAYLDLLYYYTKGARFVIDPLTEVSVRKLNRRKIAAYLKRYRNPKFVQFVKGTLA